MRIAVDENWWKEMFDDVYLLTDARSVCDPCLTCREVDFLEATLGANRDSAILDLCGGHGRHSLELARRGFRNVTVLDFSGFLIERGRKEARRDELDTIFIQGDARHTGLRANSFDHVIIMASSFGYFIDDEENRKILSEACRVLVSGGTLLMDLPDREYLVQNHRSHSRHAVDDDVTVIRERELDDGIVRARERVESRRDGVIRDRTYCMRLYSPEAIEGLVRSAGFSYVECRRNFMDRRPLGDYGSMTNRMIVTANKG